ncbi:hypothetical protein [Caulobacter radicis]|uniref:hypothetical protein n=1 Tax=Caulobacter radicis TaxID=2172650 RepID=UPI001058072D|nr:hypothetical protein [Caulobacter radicis]
MAAHPILHVDAGHGLAMAIIARASEPTLLLGDDLIVIAASASFCRAFEVDPGQTGRHEGETRDRFDLVDRLFEPELFGYRYGSKRVGRGRFQSRCSSPEACGSSPVAGGRRGRRFDPRP